MILRNYQKPSDRSFDRERPRTPAEASPFEPAILRDASRQASQSTGYYHLNPMSRLVAIASLLICPLLAQSQTLPQGFGWFATLVGACWSGTFPDGKTRHEQCYTTQFNRFMRGTARLFTEQEGKQVIAFTGDSHFAWNEAKSAIDYYIWGSDGSYRQLEARYEGDELHFPTPSRSDPLKVSVRSVWRRVDATTFEVRRDRLDGGEWKQELAVMYRREGSSP